MTKKHWWLLLSAALLLLPNLFSYHLSKIPGKPLIKEIYVPSLSKRIKNVDQLNDYVDSIARATNVKVGSPKYSDILLKTVEERFFHSYSYYSLKENWIAAVCGRLFWRDLSAIVIPDDILKYPMAACSQQSMVIMAILKAKGISYRKLGFDHHYTLEGKFGEKWIYLDPDMEPKTIGTNLSWEDICSQKLYNQLYNDSVEKGKITSIFSHPKFELKNIDPAPHATLFHKVTKLLSHWLWLLPIVLFAFTGWKK